MQAKKEMKVLLATGFKELVKKVPIEKITIKEITDQAGAIRPTFYYHFQDKYELVEWIIENEVFEPVRILFKNGMYHEAVILIFNNLYKEKEFYKLVSKLEGQNSFEGMFKKAIYDILYAYIEPKVAGRKMPHEWLNADHLADYYSNSMTFIVMRWIHMGMSAAPEEMVHIYEYIARHSLYEIVDEMNQADQVD